MDPRIRRRRIEVRRTEGRRRLRLLLAGLTVLAVTAGVWFGLRSPVLDVDRVQVEGAGRTAAEAVVAAAGIAEGQPMVEVDLHAAARRVETLPWVDRAELRRAWPGSVIVAVTERRPSAVTSTNAETWAVLDSTGRVLEVVADRPPNLVVLEGLGDLPEPGGTVAAAAGPLSVFSALTPGVAARTAAVVALEGGQIELKLNPRGTVRLGPPDAIEAKVKAAETVLASVDVGNLAVLDVRLPSSPVLTRG